MNTIDTLVIGGGQAGLAAQPLPHRARPGPPRARARPHRRALAQRTVGLAAPAHPELDDPAARMDLRRRRSRRVHDRTEVAAFFRGYAALVRRTGARAHDHPPSRRTRRRLRRRHRRRRVLFDNVVIATGWCDRPAIPAMAGQLSSRIHQVSPPATAARTRFPTAASWWSARPPLEFSSPTSCTTPAATSRSPSAATAACLASTGAWTSSGGST